MILLEFGSKVLEEAIAQLLADGPRSYKVECADFDGCSFLLSTSGSDKSTVTVSMRWRAWNDLKANGAPKSLGDYYGSMVTSAEAGYDFSIKFELDQAKKDSTLANKVSMLKAVAFAAPFHSVFAAVSAGSSAPPMTTLNYRDGEAIYIKPEGDRVIVIFSISFRELDDQVLAKVFLQEFADARRKMNNAPSVAFASKEPPLELKDVKGVRVGDNQSYVSFVLFKGHLSDKNRGATINSLVLFRNYLHYHIKCSKAYMHDRMRRRVFTLLQVLNRAKMEREVEKKTATGRTFTRA